MVKMKNDPIKISAFEEKPLKENQLDEWMRKKNAYRWGPNYKLINDVDFIQLKHNVDSACKKKSVSSCLPSNLTNSMTFLLYTIVCLSYDIVKGHRYEFRERLLRLGKTSVCGLARFTE